MPGLDNPLLAVAAGPVVVVVVMGVGSAAVAVREVRAQGGWEQAHRKG